MPNGSLSVPHYKQEHPYSCLAACVRMVLACHGRDLTEQELRQRLGTQPHGTRAGNVTVIGSLGFDVQIGPSNFAQLQAMLAAGRPPIVFVQTGPLHYWTVNCFHVVVLLGEDGTQVHLNDPFFDAAPQQAPLAQFQSAWALTGHLAAFFRPKPC